jgi:tRNA pseudouridine55 synthase
MNRLKQDSSGLLLVDKPTGVTSHTVVAQVRKALLKAFPHWDPRHQPASRRPKGGPRLPRFKCGHAGTLDPLATGLLLILVGKCSRLSPFLMGMDKSYLATIRFGEATDSLDSDGEVVATAAVPDDPGVVLEQLEQFKGDILQVPPMVSALKFQGQPLYKLVRQGKPLPELKARPVKISRLEIVETRWENSEMDILVDCSSGTYIRSLARDLAQASGSEGHLVQLRRLSIGPFGVDSAIDDVMAGEGVKMASAMLPLSRALPEAPLVEIDALKAAALRQGVQPDPSWLAGVEKSSFQMGKEGSIFRMVGPQGDLVAVGRLDEESGDPRIAAVIPAEMEAPDACD